MRNRRDTAFTVELLGLFILLIAVITIVTSVFVLSRSHSLEAKSLNEAVILAQNTVETASAANDDDALTDKLEAMDNNAAHSVISQTADKESGSWNAFFASVRRNGSEKEGLYIVCVTRRYPYGTRAERSDKGTYAEDTIEVFEAGTAGAAEIGQLAPSALGEPLYTLVSGNYFGPDSYGEKGGTS